MRLAAAACGHPRGQGPARRGGAGGGVRSQASGDRELEWAQAASLRRLGFRRKISWRVRPVCGVIPPSCLHIQLHLRLLQPREVRHPHPRAPVGRDVERVVVGHHVDACACRGGLHLLLHLEMVILLQRMEVPQRGPRADLQADRRGRRASLPALHLVVHDRGVGLPADGDRLCHEPLPLQDGVGPGYRVRLANESRDVSRLDNEVSLRALAIDDHHRLCDLAQGIDPAHGGVVGPDEDAMVPAAEVTCSGAEGEPARPVGE
mmetsp:Transcript_35807/g.113184  ORF Transcript_35807/g.113184 Transcript_35807/m.113184 type:complete len:262 (-) Transcript_35807:391-1176(-)